MVVGGRAQQVISEEHTSNISVSGRQGEWCDYANNDWERIQHLSSEFLSQNLIDHLRMRASRLAEVSSFLFYRLSL